MYCIEMVARLQACFVRKIDMCFSGEEGFTFTTPLLDRHNDCICVNVTCCENNIRIFEENVASELHGDTPEWVESILKVHQCKLTDEGIGKDNIKETDLAKQLYNLSLCAAEISWGLHVEAYLRQTS